MLPGEYVAMPKSAPYSYSISVSLMLSPPGMGHLAQRFSRRSNNALRYKRDNLHYSSQLVLFVTSRGLC